MLELLGGYWLLVLLHRTRTVDYVMAIMDRRNDYSNQLFQHTANEYYIKTDHLDIFSLLCVWEPGPKSKP